MTSFNVIWLGCLVGEFSMLLFLDFSFQANQTQLEMTLQFSAWRVKVVNVLGTKWKKRIQHLICTLRSARPKKPALCPGRGTGVTWQREVCR